MKKDVRCGECGRSVNEEQMCVVDGAHVCTGCMYGDAKPFLIYPIGVVRNNLQRNPGGFGVRGEGISRIELAPGQKRFMHKLEDEKSVTIIYYFHKAGPVKSVFKRGLEGKEVGVFASRTPDRLSRIAVRNVRLVKIEGTTLYVENLDAIDGSPVLDIKLGQTLFSP